MVDDCVMKKLNVLNQKCYELVAEHSVPCNRKSCSAWVKTEEYKNCSILASERKHTLEEISNMFDISRMRICQIQYDSIKQIHSALQMLRLVADSYVDDPHASFQELGQELENLLVG